MFIKDVFVLFLFSIEALGIGMLSNPEDYEMNSSGVLPHHYAKSIRALLD